METVYKYLLQPGNHTIEMPKKAEILTINTQDEEAFVWAKIDTNQTTELRRFFTTGTGMPILNCVKKQYVGSFMMNNKSLVFHVFEILE